jgi:hypothetical protein
MHPTFIAKLQPREIVDERGNVKLVVDPNAPGPIASAYSVASTTPERDSDVVSSAPIQVADVPLPRNAPQAKQGARPEEPSFAQRLSNFFRTGSTDKSEQSRIAAVQPAPEPQAKPAAKPGLMSRITGLRGSNANAAPSPRPAQAAAVAAKPAAQPQAADPKVQTAAAGQGAQPAAVTPPAGTVINGAQPIPATSNFDSRWGAFR